ncbi:MAG: hypothetical protein MUO72_15030 [Bacteroidales bacterium]|nr:hypothetical protein [Bacteroidales bacterium]
MIKKILTLSSEISHIIRSFYDSAYDGIFQSNLGWGVLEADEADEVRILSLLSKCMADQEVEKNENSIFLNNNYLLVDSLQY